MQSNLKSFAAFAKKYLFCQDTCILALFLIGAGALSVWLEQEMISDFLLYHYYNGFSFLNDRLALDVAPAGIATYYNPLLDALFYLLDNTFSKNPFLFIMGLPAGVALFIVYKIADPFFTDKKKVWIPACLLISLTGFAFFRQIGTCSHEITLACFVLGALYILLQKPSKPVWYFIAGALLGAAAGFKLTAAIYCVSTGITLLLFYKTLEKPKTFIGVFILGGLIGFLAIDGFWMWTLWKNFQNPFFPFWNKIFKSPFFFDANYVDDLHLSYDWKKLLFLPFNLFSGNIYERESINSRDLVSNLSFFDARWMFGFILLLVFSVRLLNRSFRQSVSEKTFFITAFMLLSYLIWLFSSQNIRFVIPVEMLFGIVFIKVLSSYAFPQSFFKEVLSKALICVLSYILLSPPLLSGRWGSYSRSVLPDNAVFPKNALILTSGHHNAYYAAKFAERTNARILNAAPNYSLPYMNFSDTFLVNKRKEIIDQNFFPEIVIMTVHPKVRFEIENKKCFYFDSIPLFLERKMAVCAYPKIIHDIFYNGSKTTSE